MWISAHAQPACVWKKTVALFLDLVGQASIDTLDAVLQAPAHQLVEQDEVRGGFVCEVVSQTSQHGQERRALPQGQEESSELIVHGRGQHEHPVTQLARQPREKLW